MALAFLSVAHVNVNCAQLGRSLTFYRDALGFSPLSHTNPLPQDGAGFGLSGPVQWDAWILHDDRGQSVQGIDLLEWKQPAPTGRPALAHGIGLSRLLLEVRDVRALHARLAAAGAPPCTPCVALGGTRFGFVARDPDGAALEITESASGSDTPRLVGIALGVGELAQAVPWYERLLARRAGATERHEAASAAFGGAETARWLEAEIAATATFTIRLVEWERPRAAPAPRRAANSLGLYRMAFGVEDAAKACAQLSSLGLAHSGAVWLDMGPEIPIEGLQAGFFLDPDGACLEWIELPRPRGAG